MSVRAVVALGILIGVVLVAIQVTAATAPPLAASTPPTWHRVAEEEFTRLAVTQRPALSVAPVTHRATPKPAPRPGHGRFIVQGVATMTDTRCAAAGPALRNALGAHWRGTPVRVWFRGQARDTWLCDWCACRDRPGGPTVIDLPPAMFQAFGQAPGVIPVRIERVP